MTVPSCVGNATNGIGMTKQYGHTISKTDIDDHGNSIRINQYKATLLYELAQYTYHH